MNKQSFKKKEGCNLHPSFFYHMFILSDGRAKTLAFIGPSTFSGVSALKIDKLLHFSLPCIASTDTATSRLCHLSF